MIGRSEIQRAFEPMHKRLVVFFALALFGCRSLPDAEPPVFFLCASNVAAVRTDDVDSSNRSAVEVVLRAHARREFELLTKRSFGESIRLAAGDAILGRVTVLFGIRTGRISFTPESLPSREVFGLLDPPPDSPCGMP